MDGKHCTQYLYTVGGNLKF